MAPGFARIYTKRRPLPKLSSVSIVSLTVSLWVALPEHMKRVQLITDGACLGNPGPGGWAAILRYKSRKREIFGSEPATTNNRMELTAAVRGLSALSEPCEVEIVTDSEYVKNGVTSWIH